MDQKTNDQQSFNVIYETHYPVPGKNNIMFNFLVDIDSEDFVNLLDNGLSVFFIDVKGQFVSLRDFLDERIEMQLFLKQNQDSEDGPFYNPSFDFFGIRINRTEVKKLIYFFEIIKDKVVASYNNYVSSFDDYEDNDILPFAKSIYEFIEPVAYLKSTATIRDDSKTQTIRKPNLIFVNNTKNKE